MITSQLTMSPVMKIYSFCFVFSLFCLAKSENIILETHVDPEEYLSTTDITARLGYPAETHTIQTEDGYLLNLHRIPHSKFLPAGPRPVVYFQHGLLASSDCWVISRIAFLFSDKGYDVWMGNVRGNTYSRQHVNLTTSDSKYWDFSWDEMAAYDVPASLEYVLNVTRQSKLSYIGHSMGTTIFFAMASSRTEFNDKIDTMIALAPVAYVSHMKSPMRLIAPWANDIDYILDILGKGEFLGNNKFLQFVTNFLCDRSRIQKEICTNALFVFVGFDTAELDEKKLPVILAHNPAGTSVKVINHYAQLINSDSFSKYDFGQAGNLKHYNTSKPPTYDLSLVTIPVVLFSSSNDLLVDDTDLQRLQRQLPNVAESYRIPYKNFNHIDFVFAKDCLTLVYAKVLDILSSYQSRPADVPFHKEEPQVVLTRNVV